MIAHNTRDPKSNCGTCPKRITYTRMVRLSHNILENSTKSMANGNRIGNFKANVELCKSHHSCNSSMHLNIQSC